MRRFTLLKEGGKFNKSSIHLLGFVVDDFEPGLDDYDDGDEILWPFITSATKLSGIKVSWVLNVMSSLLATCMPDSGQRKY